MTTIIKWILIAIAVCVVGFAAAYGTSRYLANRLDGRGPSAPALQTQSSNQTPTHFTSQYSSEDGLAFEYPEGYGLSSNTQTINDVTWQQLLLVPEQAVVQDGEAPPAIAISVFPAPGGQSLGQWVRTDSRSNFKLSGSALASTTVGGEPALSYQYSGLYETDAVAVLHGGKIFLFEAGWLSASDPIRQDFQNILKTVHFTL